MITMYFLGILCLMGATVALPMLQDCCTSVLPDSEYRSNIQKAARYVVPLYDIKDNKKVNKENFKITSVVIPSAPELPPFDYSILRNQIAEQKQKYDDSLKKQAEQSQIEKETIIQDIEKPVQIVRPSNPSTSICSRCAASVAIPPPPQLPPFDYSTLIKQRAEAEKSKEQERVTLNLEKNVEVPCCRTTLADTDTDQAEDEKDNEEVKQNMVKVVIPAPPELPPFDYSILRNQIAEQKQKYDDYLKKQAEQSQIEKETIIQDIEKPVQIVRPSNPSTSICSRCAASVAIPPPPQLPPFNYSTLIKQRADAEKSKEQERVTLNLEKNVEVPCCRTTLADSDADQAEDEKDNEEVKQNMVKVVIPAPPELPPFDYSILRNQIAEQKQKSDDYLKKQAEQSQIEKETIIQDIEKPVQIAPTSLCSRCAASVAIPPPPQLPPFDYSTLIKQRADAEKSKEQERVTLNLEKNVEVPCCRTTLADSDADQAEDEKDNEEVKQNMVKVVIPAPPELPPFDYSILRNQIAEQKQKSDDYLKKQAEQSQIEKETIIQDIEKPVQIAPTSLCSRCAASVAIPPPPQLPPFDYSTLIKQRAEAEKSKEQERVTLNLEKNVEVPCCRTTLADSDADQAEDEKDNEEVKQNMVKVVIPAPPELPPFDYSILRNQIAEQKQKSDDYLKKQAEQSQIEKETIIQDIEKPVQIAPTSLCSRCAASVAIPPPPQLPPFDYSTLIKQRAEAEKSKEQERVTLNLEKNVEVPCCRTTLADSVAIVPVSDHIPEVIHRSISTAPFLCKLISNCQTL